MIECDVFNFLPPYESPLQVRCLFFVIFLQVSYYIKFHSFLFYLSFCISFMKSKISLINFLKALCIITNDSNYRNEEHFVTKRARNEKLVQKPLCLLHFHKVQYNGDTIYFNANQHVDPVFKKGFKNKML